MWLSLTKLITFVVSKQATVNATVACLTFHAPSVLAQNLIINPEFKDKTTGEYSEEAYLPVGWHEYSNRSKYAIATYNLSQNMEGTILYKGEKCFLTVSPPKHLWGYKHFYLVATLMQPLKAGCQYELKFGLPGNDKVDLLYTFVETLETNPENKDAFIASLDLDTAILKGTNSRVSFSGKNNNDRYMIFAFIDHTGYNGGACFNQHVRQVELIPKTCKHTLDEVSQRWVQQVYKNEDLKKTPDKTIGK